MMGATRYASLESGLNGMDVREENDEACPSATSLIRVK
jgi:hypothetical protein